MQYREATFKGAQNLGIYRQSWLPVDTATRGAVVIVHGLGEHSGRYAHVAALLVGRGFAVYALDHRGHGKSEGQPRAFIDRFANAVADIDQLVELAAREQRGKPVFLLGHSMGGALALSYAIKHRADNKKLAGLILSGPAVRLDGAPPLMKPIVAILSKIAPKLGVFQVDPSFVSRDQAVVADYASDPLNCHGKVPARTLAELVKFVDILPGLLQVIELPLLILHGRADKLAGVAGSEMVAKLVASKDKTLKIYDELYHEIFNELPADRARVFADLCEWLETHVGAINGARKSASQSPLPLGERVG